MKHAFSLQAWRRMYLPWLFFVLVLSLTLDGLLLHFYSSGLSFVNAYAQSMGRIGLLFLALVNLALMKALPIHRYLYRKALLQKSHVQTGCGVIIHYVQDSSMPRWKVESATEMRLPKNGKTEYLTYNVFIISAVRQLRRKAGGRLCVLGTIDHKYVNEYEPETYGDNDTEAHHFTRKTHVIPGYYAQMEEVERALEGMKRG